MFCTQSMGSSVGIIVRKNQRLALFVSIGIFCFFNVFDDFMFPLTDSDPHSIIIGDPVYPKFLFKSMLIAIYGFGRCEYPEKSYVLHKNNVNDDNIFWINSKYLLFICLIFKSIEFLLLLRKANEFSLKLFNRKICKSNEKTDISVEIDINEKQIDSYENQIESSQKESKELMIAWIDLSFVAKQMFIRKQAVILNDLSGGIEIGSFNALMGPSGAGKTTLLKCLLDKRYTNALEERTQIFKNSRIRVKPCFVNQNICDHLLRGLTVRQTLLYASKLKNSLESNEFDHKNKIRYLMKDLMIDGIEDTKVDDCSGGEQKRVVIASELTAYVKPNLLCIDEPTSGLDSTSALMVFHFE